MNNFDLKLITTSELQIVELVALTDPLTIGLKEQDQPPIFKCYQLEFTFRCDPSEVKTFKNMAFVNMSFVDWVSEMFDGHILISTSDPIMDIADDVKAQFKIIPTADVDLLYLTNLLTQMVQNRLSTISETMKIVSVSFKHV